MKKFLSAAVIVCFTLPAKAQQETVKSNSYLTFRAGANYTNVKVDGDKYHKTVPVVTAAVGTKQTGGNSGIGDFRIEAELALFGNFKETELDGTDRIEYKQNAVNVSFNLLKDFKGENVTLYVGAGAGVAVFFDELKYDITVGARRYVGLEEKSNAVLNANLQAGLTFPVTDTVSFDVNARYTYFDTYKIFNDTIKIQNSAVNVSAGLRLAF